MAREHITYGIKKKKKLAKGELVFWLSIAIVLAVCIAFGVLIARKIIPAHIVDFDGVSDFFMTEIDGIEYYHGELQAKCSLINPYTLDDIRYVSDTTDDMKCQSEPINGVYRRLFTSNIDLEYPEQDKAETLNNSPALIADSSASSNTKDLNISDGKISFIRIYAGISENGSSNPNPNEPFIYTFTAYNDDGGIKAVYKLSVFLELDNDSKSSLTAFHQLASEKRAKMLNAVTGGITETISPPYRELLENSELYDGEMVTYTGIVHSINGDDGTCRIWTSKFGYSDSIILERCKTSGQSDDFVGGDAITVWGQSLGNEKAADGETLPKIYAIRIQWVKDAY